MDPNNSSPLQILLSAYHNPHKAAQEYREKEWPIFAYLTQNVPVELLHAADILPVRIQGGKIADLAPGHLQTFSCSYCRSAIHQAMNGEYDYLDGLLSAKTCDVALSLFQIWTLNRSFDFTWLVSLPGKSDEEAINYFREELLHLRIALEAYRNTRVTDQKLEASISLYNELRGLVSQLWRKRDNGSLALTGGEIIGALKGCQVLSPHVSLGLLRNLVGNGEKTGGAPGKGIRLMLLGNTFVDVSLAEIIEKSGGRIVIDDTSATGRHFDSPVRIEGGPLTSLARYYVSKVAGSYRLTYQERRDHILQLIRNWKIDACIQIIQKFCDTSTFESPLVDQDLKRQKIPSLTIEIDDTSLALGQVETRVQAFLEMVGDFQW